MTGTDNEIFGQAYQAAKIFKSGCSGHGRRTGGYRTAAYRIIPRIS